MSYVYHCNDDILASMAYWKERKLKREAQKSPEQRKLDEKQRSPEQAAKRESDGNKRVAFIKALIASGRLDEWSARVGGRLDYLAMCEELGIEPAGIDGEIE